MEEVLENWNLEIGQYRHECGEKMVCLVKTDRTGLLTLSEVPVFCPKCDDSKVAMEILASHILTILGVSSEDYKKSMYLFEKATKFIR
jgi:hypothetical protein